MILMTSLKYLKQPPCLNENLTFIYLTHSDGFPMTQRHCLESIHIHKIYRILKTRSVSN